MSEPLTKLVINCETKEQTIVPLTAEEIAQREADAAAWAAAEAERIAAAEAAAEAKASGIAKLLALGLTEEEANALVK
jgi:hypothetical protein